MGSCHVGSEATWNNLWKKAFLVDVVDVVDVVDI
jgi:hypothetical protein